LISHEIHVALQVHIPLNKNFEYILDVSYEQNARCEKFTFKVIV